MVLAGLLLYKKEKVVRMRKNKSQEARKLFESGMALVDIAKKLEVPSGTVRRWKSEQKWSSERSEKESERSPGKSERSEKVSRQQEERSKRSENFDVENSELTEKQRLFCSYYVRCFNATKAYQKAYGCAYTTANTEGPRTLVNPCIQNEIRKLKQNKLNQEFLSESDIFQKYIDIAFSDITDYVEFGQERVPVLTMHGPVKIKNKETGEEELLMKIVSTVKLKESEEVDGSIITEVKQGKDGIGIKLADRMKALQWLADHMDLATEEQRTRIEVMRVKAQLNEEAEMEDDGFLEALKGSAVEDWADEEET